MLKNTYDRFNRECFSPEKYKVLREKIFSLAGDTCMRMREGPVFITHSFAHDVIQGAREIIQQSLHPSLRPQLEAAVMPEFKMPRPPQRPSFFIIDFAVTREGPRLIEMQGFAANLMFIPAVAAVYKEIYGLDDRYQYLLSETAVAAAQETILGNHAPENVVLMEINPWQQDSRRDFVVTQKLLGIPVVDIRDVLKKGRQLFYRHMDGKEVLIRRVYNRLVPHEFQQLRLASQMRFQFTDDLDVEWVGDPAWFMRVSKYTMPFLNHELVPKTVFLNQVKNYPFDLENYVLKPVFSCAGAGVKINIVQKDLDAIAEAERHNYVLMEKVSFAPFIPDLSGNMLNAEVRIMLVWPDAGELQPVAFSGRVMHNNDTNENLWGDDAGCGMAPVMIVDPGDE